MAAQVSVPQCAMYAMPTAEMKSAVERSWDQVWVSPTRLGRSVGHRALGGRSPREVQSHGISPEHVRSEQGAQR